MQKRMKQRRLNKEVGTVNYSETEDDRSLQLCKKSDVTPESLAQKLIRISYSEVQWFLKKIGKNN